MSLQKERLLCVIAIIISLPLSISFAASQSILFGSFFGFILALGIDGLIGTFRKAKETVNK